MLWAPIPNPSLYYHQLYRACMARFAYTHMVIPHQMALIKTQSTTSCSDTQGHVPLRDFHAEMICTVLFQPEFFF